MGKRLLQRATSVLCAALIVGGCTPAAKKKRYSEAAERYYQSGEYDKARIEYMNLLQLDQQNEQAFAHVGMIWADDGAPLRAGAFLMRALELAPQDNATRKKLVRVYLAVGRPADARKEALTLLEKTPGDGEALVLLVDASQKPEELADAEQRVNQFSEKESPYVHLARAGLAAKKGDRNAIEPELERAIAADPKLAVAHGALASWYRATNELNKAATEFEKAANNTPLRSVERQALAEFKVQLGQIDQADSLLKAVTDKAPDFLPAWILQAKIANREKKYDDALRLIENVLSRDANNIEGRVVQAETWLARGQTKKALDSLESLNTTFPQTPMIKYTMAQAYLQSNNTNQAMSELDEVVRLSPNFPEAVLLRAELRLKNGDPQSIIEPLQRLLSISPQLTPAAVLLAEAYRASGRLDEAAGIIQEQIKRAPKNASFHAMLGMILRQQNKNDEAQQEFEQALQIDPANEASITQLVDLDVSRKDFATALRRVTELREKAPHSGTPYYLEGKVDAAQGKFDLAQEALFKAIDLEPDQNRSYDLLLGVYPRANKLPEALQRLNSILAKKPDDARALLLSGLIYDQLKDSTNARTAYEKVLAINPNSVPALNNLAYIYAEKLNDLTKAADLAQKARSIAPNDPSVLDTLGWILYKQGEYQQASDLLAQAVARNSAGPEIEYHRGMANYMMGRSDVARAALEKAAAAPENFAGKDEAKRYLAMLDNNKQQSVAELEAVLKQQPNDPIALMKIGAAYEGDGAMSKAADAYEHALTLNPKLATAALKIAQLNAGPLKDPEKAMEFAKKARELAPTDPKATAIVGSIALQLNNTAWAYGLLQESARQLPGDATVLHDLAWAAYLLGKTDEATNSMQQVLDSHPSTTLHDDAEKFLAMAKEPANASAEPDIQKVLASDPAYLPALVARAAVQSSNGDTKAASATYSTILQRWPEFAPAQRDLAALLIQDPQNVDAAYDLATKARKTLPGDPKIAEVLGRVNYERKEYGRAIQLFQEAQLHQPLDPVSLYYLGMAHAQAKHSNQAREALNQSLTQGLPEPQAADARQTLATLGSP
ncbi:MAG: tetratricopeptide repeat protein [Verrucomicrobia bacterium]|nr:tetratricopeptide repeat protein [Verrucomicrobiota bacterium]